MQINAAKPTMAARPFQFSALVLQKELANGSFLVNPLQAMTVSGLEMPCNKKASATSTQ